MEVLNLTKTIVLHMKTKILLFILFGVLTLVACIKDPQIDSNTVENYDHQELYLICNQTKINNLTSCKSEVNDNNMHIQPHKDKS